MFIKKTFLGAILLSVLIQTGCSTYRLRGSTYSLICIQGQGCLVLDDVDFKKAQLRILDASLVEIDSSDLGEMGARFEGVGRFEIGSHQCLVSEDRWTCDGRELDMSDGAVVVSPEGKLYPTPLLPLFAR